MEKIQTEKNVKPTRREKAEMRDRMRGFLMFLPNMFKLLGRLLKDNRVPTTEKVLVAGAILYVIMPLDFIPDVIPFIGQVDDVYLVGLTLLRLLNKTDEDVIRRHWSGGGDIVALASSVAKIAPLLLPKRVSRVLSAEIELTEAGNSFGSPGKKSKTILSEVDNQKV